MPPHFCTKEKEIDRLGKAVFGNGEDGLVRHVASILQNQKMMQQDVSDMKSDVKDLLTGIHALQIFRAEMQTGEAVKEKNSLNNWQKASIVFGFLGVVAAFIAIFVT